MILKDLPVITRPLKTPDHPPGTLLGPFKLPASYDTRIYDLSKYAKCREKHYIRRPKNSV